MSVRPRRQDGGRGHLVEDAYQKLISLDMVERIPGVTGDQLDRHRQHADAAAASLTGEELAWVRSVVARESGPGSLHDLIVARFGPYVPTSQRLAAESAGRGAVVVELPRR